MTKSIPNAFLKYKVATIPQVKLVDTSSFQQGWNAYYMKDHLNLNNQGKDMLANTVTETNFTTEWKPLVIFKFWLK